jgi:hypothetical protein
MNFYFGVARKEDKMYRMNPKHFISFEDFLSVAVWFQDCFVQCVECRSLRLADEIPKESAKFLGKLIDEFNSWAPCMDELKAFGFKISHGSCKLCIRERLIEVSRRRQIKEGYYPCFGTAVDGHCSEQGKCKYYNSCVTTQEEIEDHRGWQKVHPKNALPTVLVEPEEICYRNYYSEARGHESSSMFL